MADVPAKVRDLFLDLIARGNTAACAARTVGVRRNAMFDLRKRDPEFARQWAEADEAGTEALEQEAIRRAVEGVERGLFYQGVKYTTEREFSDPLLMFLLRARAPEKYRERYEVKHEVGDSIVQRLQAGRQRALQGRIIEGEAVVVADDERKPELIDADDPILQ